MREFPVGRVTVLPVGGGSRTPDGTDGGPGADTMFRAAAVVAAGR